MIIKKVFVVLMLISLFKCKETNSGSHSKLWKYELHNSYFYNQYEKEEITKEEFLTLFRYPVQTGEFDGKSFSEVFDAIIEKAQLSKWSLKKCPTEDICAEVSAEGSYKEDFLSYELVIVNRTKTLVILDTVELEIRLSKFDVPSTFTYTNFEQPEVDRNSKSLNNLYVPSEFLEDKILVSANKFLDVTAKDYEVNLLKVKLSKGK